MEEDIQAMRSQAKERLRALTEQTEGFGTMMLTIKIRINLDEKGR
jgi:hypothetical protein